MCGSDNDNPAVLLMFFLPYDLAEHFDVRADVDDDYLQTLVLCCRQYDKLDTRIKLEVLRTSDTRPLNPFPHRQTHHHHLQGTPRPL